MARTIPFGSTNPLHVLQAIQSYRLLDLGKSTIDQVSWHLVPCFPLYLVRTIPIAPDRVFRVRELDDPNSPHLTVQDFQCLPPHRVKKFGRAHRPGSPVLYVAASDPATAIQEVGIQPGQHFMLASYTMSPSSAPGAKPTLAIHPAAGESDEEEPEQTQAERDQTITARIVRDFYTTEFTRPVLRHPRLSYLHKASCAIAERMFGLGDVDADSLLYPSTHDYQTFNLAIKAEAAETRLALQDVYQATLTPPLSQGECAFQVVGHFKPGPDGLLHPTEDSDTMREERPTTVLTREEIHGLNREVREHLRKPPP